MGMTIELAGFLEEKHHTMAVTTARACRVDESDGSHMAF